MRPGGVVGVKEFDHGGDLIHPYDPPLQKFYALYRRLRKENGHEPDGGRKIGVFLIDAGFREVQMSACYESLAVRGVARAFIGVLSEQWGDAFRSCGWATPETIEEMAESWRRFARTPGAFYAGAWCEALARKSREGESS